ncbi:MAG: hypothetical protein ABW003_24985 [Microvirga sp.]
MPVRAESPLSARSTEPGWQQHAKTFETAFTTFEREKRSRIRKWSSEHLQQPASVVHYMFSGPDFLHADAFFPAASTYVLSGLEPVGELPDPASLSAPQLARALGGLKSSLRNVLALSYFITANMGHDLAATRLSGTLPVIYVFLARTGHTITDVQRVMLDDAGEIVPDTSTARRPNRGAKISFRDGAGKEKTLFYFSTNLANDGFKEGPFARFSAKLGKGDSFIKSASYLLHGGGFSEARKFLLGHSKTIVQDDTGIPLRILEAEKWEVRAFGKYTKPIPDFSEMYQRQMKVLFDRQSTPIDFGIGYRSRRNQSGLIVATKMEQASR